MAEHKATTIDALAVGPNFNPLPNPAKRNSGETLVGLVADASGFYQQVKTAHWNLRDRNFLTIHRLLDEVAATVLTGIDEMAERARQLGMIIDGNLNTLAGATRVGVFPTGIVSAPEACTTLCTTMGMIVEFLRNAIDNMDGSHADPVTVDLLTRISGELEVQLWLLESHLT